MNLHTNRSAQLLHYAHFSSWKIEAYILQRKNTLDQRWEINHLKILEEGIPDKYFTVNNVDQIKVKYVEKKTKKADEQAIRLNKTNMMLRWKFNENLQPTEPSQNMKFSKKNCNLYRAW